MGELQTSIEVLFAIAVDPNAVTEEKLHLCRAILERILNDDGVEREHQWLDVCAKLNENIPTWRRQWRARLEAIESIEVKRNKNDLVALNGIHNSLLAMFEDIRCALGPASVHSLSQ